jgi:glycerol-1-phosphate dehydrogenase [NAD(P)+]
MEDLCFGGRPVSHGFKVGIGTLASTATLEFLLEQDLSKLDVEEKVSAWWPSFEAVKATFPSVFPGRPAHVRRAELEYAKKFPSKDALRKELTAIRGNWGDLAAKIRAQLMPFEEVKENLRKVGAPTEPEEIGVTRARFRETFAGVPYMRARYFGADLVQRLGLMPALLDRLFGAGGVWATK